ncbi:MAG: hypothetical protein ABSE92_01465 [Terriglobales bacterium]|jgi:hypothetical protein
MISCREIFSLALFFTFAFTFAYAQRPREPKAQEVFAPYWSSEPGWETELQLKNNLRATDLTVVPLLRMAEGEEIALAPVTIPANAAVTVMVNDELTHYTPQKDLPNPLNQPGSYGSVVFRFSSFHARNLSAAVTLRMRGRPVGFGMNAYPTVASEMPLRMARAGSWEGIWWQQHAGAHDILVFANSAEENVAGTLWLSDASGKHWSKSLTLGGHQTQRLDVSELLHESGLSGSYGGLKFDVPAFAPALSAVHLVSDEAAGFGATLKMFAHDPATTVQERMGPNAKQWTTFAPMLALQTPDPATGFPSGTTLQPMIFVRNTTAKNLNASITLSWRGDSAKGQVALPELNLAPYETRKIDISTMQKPLNIPDDAHWALVTLSATVQPDELIATAVSYDSTGKYGTETPFSDNLGGYFVGGEWKADGKHNGLISVTNGGAKPADTLLTLHYDSGMKKYELEQTIAPGDQLWFNVEDLIHNRIADRKGNLLPADLTSGTYDLQQIGGKGTLLPASQSADSTWGHEIRGGQVDCCGDYGSSFEPGSFDLVENQPNPFEVTGINQCTGATEDLTSLFSFSVQNPAIATISKDTLTGISPGLTNADGVGYVWYCQGDTGGWEKEYPTAPVTVTPEIQFQGNTINGKTQSVVVGQQIALTAVYNPPSGLTVKSRQWTVGGTTVGGFNTGNTNGGSTTATLTNDAATFYWVTLGNSLNVGFTVTFSDNSTASALTKFNVAGPSSPSVVTKVGTINTLNNTKLVLGGSGSNIGIEFTPSASAPSGYSNTWVYVQLIDSLTIKLITGNTVTVRAQGSTEHTLIFRQREPIQTTTPGSC